jgi:phage tail-like protein
MNEPARFRYLNRDGRWDGFRRTGLVLRADSGVELASLPVVDGAVPEELLALPSPDQKAGIAVGPDGTIYFADPAGQRVLRIDGCDQRLAAVPCFGGAGGQPTQLTYLYGLTYHAQRQLLLVADAGNHRIQLVDPASGQLVGLWPRRGGGASADELDIPTGLGVGADGSVYVLDAGQRRILRLDASGEPVPAFWRNVVASLPAWWSFEAPVDLAVQVTDGVTEVFLLDAGTPTRVCVFAADGTCDHPIDLGVGLERPVALAVAADALYVGDAGGRRVCVFLRDGTYLGEAHGYRGPVAGLALDSRGGLLVHTGTERAPVRLSLTGAYTAHGVLWGGPVVTPSRRAEQWHKVGAAVSALPSGAHVRLYTFSTSDGSTPPSPEVDPAWQPVAPDGTETVIPGGPDDAVWVGVRLDSDDGVTTPVLTQLRIDFDYDGYLPDLPAVYREAKPARDFLRRFLSVFESAFGQLEAEIDRVPSLFDPGAINASYLPWLADALGIDWDEHWSEARQRQVVASAFALFARRGTAAGLRDAIRLFGDVDVRIEEPILQTDWWALPSAEQWATDDGSAGRLGFTTVLVPAEAQGAVVGTSAILDRSDLITDDEFGAPVFQEVAHQLTVQVYAGHVRCERTRENIRALVEREKPAHIAHHLCVIRPRLRVGFQARLGIDTLVGSSEPSADALGVDPRAGGLRLGGALPGRLGERSVLGESTRLGLGARP